MPESLTREETWRRMEEKALEREGYKGRNFTTVVPV